MFFNQVVVIYDNGSTLSGLITGTFNESGGGVFIQEADKEPVMVNFSAIISMTVFA